MPIYLAIQSLFTVLDPSIPTYIIVFMSWLDYQASLINVNVIPKKKLNVAVLKVATWKKKVKIMTNRS